MRKKFYAFNKIIIYLDCNQNKYIYKCLCVCCLYLFINKCVHTFFVVFVCWLIYYIKIIFNLFANTIFMCNDKGSFIAKCLQGVFVDIQFNLIILKSEKIKHLKQICVFSLEYKRTVLKVF